MPSELVAVSESWKYFWHFAATRAYRKPWLISLGSALRVRIFYLSVCSLKTWRLKCAKLARYVLFCMRMKLCLTEGRRQTGGVWRSAPLGVRCSIALHGLCWCCCFCYADGLVTFRKPAFAPGSVHVGFVVDKVALGQGFLPSVSFRRSCPCSYIAWRMNNRPVGGRNSETSSHPIDTKNNNNNNIHLETCCRWLLCHHQWAGSVM
jgi:hypothetical protein